MSNGRYRAYPQYKDSGVEWVGQLPIDWEVTRIKFCALLNSSKTELNHLPRETEVTFLPMEAIGEQGELDTSRTKILSEVSSGYTYLAEGDVCIAKITPCFENGKGAIVRGLKNGLAFATTEVVPLRCQSGNTPEFLYYLLTSAPFNKQAEGSMYGAGGQKRVADNFVANYHFAKPPLPEQTQIAKFLDHETAKIDRLIEKQEELIRLLKEKRQAVISHAVTKGLNPHAPLKDSGIPWLGQVPAHWIVQEMKRVCAVRGGFAFNSDAFIEAGKPVIRIGDIRQDGSIDLEGCKCVSDKLAARYENFSVQTDEIVMAMTGATIGKAGWFKHETPCLVNQRVGVFRRESESLDYRYLWHILASNGYQEYIRLTAFGGAQPNISDTGMVGYFTAIPPIEEQRTIIEFLDRQTAKIDALMEKAESAIGVIQERRTALISAAVTGKIDVRHWQPPSTSDLQRSDVCFV